PVQADRLQHDPAIVRPSRFLIGASERHGPALPSRPRLTPGKRLSQMVFKKGRIQGFTGNNRNFDEKITALNNIRGLAFRAGNFRRHQSTASKPSACPSPSGLSWLVRTNIEHYINVGKQ